MQGTTHWARGARTRSPYDQSEESLCQDPSLSTETRGVTEKEVSVVPFPEQHRNTVHRDRYKVPLS